MTRTALITGSSTGIGRATAGHFAERGWNVAATMRAPGNAGELAERENVRVERLDVTDSGSIESAVADTVEVFGTIDVLVNNAGYGAFGPLEAAPMDGVRRQFDTNVIGLLETTKAVLPYMRAQGSGAIVNVSSVGGRVTLPLGSLYHGTKWAVEGISEALTFELAPIGIRVKIVEPGVIATDFGGRSFDFNDDESLAEYRGVVGGVVGGFEHFMAAASPASMVADVIFQAATDDGDQLRYVAGEDAEGWLALREKEGDLAWLSEMKEQFGV